MSSDTHPCGELTHADVVCAHCREPLGLEDLAMELGPGFPRSRAARTAMAKRLQREFGVVPAGPRPSSG